MQKLCSKCNISKDIIEFNKNISRKDGLQGFCKTCSQAASKYHYTQNKQHYLNKSKSQMQKLRFYLDEIKANTPCTDCGNYFDPVCMDFDHLRDKKYSLSLMPRLGCSLQKLKLEINKCELVCSNCHRLRTKQRNIK